VHATLSGDNGLNIRAWLQPCAGTGKICETPLECRVRKIRATGLLTTLLGLAALCPGIGWAALGDNSASVQTDGIRMKATLRTIAAGGYSVHELQLPTGTLVREYLDASGTVFAVSWRGPFKPDLRQLLGQYFDTYSTAPRNAGSTRSHMAIDGASLVMRSAGHLRAQLGLAYVPQLIPAGVNPEALP